MKLIEVLEVADKAYSKEGILSLRGFYKKDGQPNMRAKGDGLAKFICIEIAETYDKDATDEDQLTQAADAIRSARNQLDEVESALISASVEERPSALDKFVRGVTAPSPKKRRK